MQIGEEVQFATMVQSGTVTQRHSWVQMCKRVQVVAYVLMLLLMTVALDGMYLIRMERSIESREQYLYQQKIISRGRSPWMEQCHEWNKNELMLNNLATQVG